MKTVGAFYAKTHLAVLLDEVEKGEVVIVTKRGRPVARLVPVAEQPKLRRRGSWRDRVVLPSQSELEAMDRVIAADFGCDVEAE